MGKVRPVENKFTVLLRSWIYEYLPNARGLSPNTIKSYKTSLTKLIDFMYSEKNISADKISFSDLDFTTIMDFLEWLQKDNNCRDSTRNNRLAALNSFAKYAQNRDFQGAAVFCSGLINNTPALTDLFGFRDRTILAFLYGSGCRGQELCDLRVKDIQYQSDGRASIRLTGKGLKTRTIRISAEVTTLLKKYIKRCGIANQPERYVFSTQRNPQMSVDCLEKIVSKYSVIARSQYPDLFKIRITPHTFRHSTATHMLEQGVPLIVISRFLGHASIVTTIVYAKLNASTIDENLLKWDKAFWNEYIDEPINDEDNKKKAGYYICDNLSLFYYRYIFRYASQRQVMAPDQFYKRYVGPDFETAYVPKRFERICRQYLIRRNQAGLMEEPFKPRMYFTCNPGGVGHQWVKRLFIDRVYKNSEKEEDYTFIPSLVYENAWLMENDPDYVRTLENLPEERRNAMLYGNWDVYDGQFFEEFDRNIHTMAPVKLPRIYRLYRAFDYGLDMFAAYHIIVDAKGDMKCIHEIYEPNLIVSEACQKLKETTKNLGFSEDDVYLTLAPSDLWNTNSQTGKSTADIFYDNGVILTEVARNRVPGWHALKELFKVITVRDEHTGNLVKTARLKIYNTCRNLIRCIPLLQYDEKKFDDCATDPHEITHGPDALRCFATYWVSAPKVEVLPKAVKMEWTEDMLDDYYNGDDRTKERMVELYGRVSG